MAKVEIDIPGIGLIEAKNAASESTLRELVNLMKGGGGGGGSGGGGSGGGGSGGGGGSSPTGQGNKFAKVLGGLSYRAEVVGKKFTKLSDYTVNLLSSFANVGDSMESAARIFANVPVVGPMFGAAASAATAVSDAFVKASGSGASFNGSVVEMTRAAGQAGMTLDAFAGFISSNGEAMVALGGTTADGAKRFGELSKSIRTNSRDLYALGYSTSDLNEGIASYAQNLRIMGRNENMSNRELVEGSKSYLKEMDMLAKITGESRKEKEEERKQLMQNIKYQAFASQLSDESQKELQLLIQSYPKELQGFVKDAVMSGTLTMEANQKQAHALGGTMNQILGIRQKLLKDERVGDSIIQGALNTTKNETQAFIKSNKEAIIGNDEYAQSMQGVTAGNKIQTDGVIKARKAQEEANAQTDGMNEQMQQSKARLAEFSNQFQMALANSGLLDLLLNSFQTVAGFLLDYIVPTFQIFAGIVTEVGNYLLTFFQPILDTITGLIRDYVYPAFLYLAAFVLTDVVPILQMLGGIIVDYVLPVFQFLGGIIMDYVLPVFTSLAGFVMDNLLPIIAGVATAMAAYKIAIFAQKVAAYAQTAAAWLSAGGLGAAAAAAWALISPLLVAAAPFIAIGAAVAAVIYGFKKLYDAGFTVGSVFETIGDFLYRYFMMPIKELFYNIQSSLPGWLGGLSDEEAKVKREQLDAEYKDLDDRATARKLKREEIQKERGTEEKLDSEGNELSARQLKMQELDLKFQGQMNDFKEGAALKYNRVNAKEQIALDGKAKLAKKTTDLTNDALANLPKEKDFMNSMTLLKQEAVQQKSGFVKDKTKDSAPSKFAVAAATQTDAKKAAEEYAGGDTGGEFGSSTTKTAQTTSEEQNVFVELNNNVIQLVRLTNQQLAVQNRTKSAIENLAGVGNLLKTV